MSLKKIKEKNPGFEFSTSTTKKASKSVLENAVQPKLDMKDYNMKYADEVTASKDSGSKDASEGKDKNWKLFKKHSTNQNIDFAEEAKSSFFDDEGNEMAAED